MFSFLERCAVLIVRASRPCAQPPLVLAGRRQRR